MSMSARSLHVAMMLALVGSLLATIVAAAGVGAAPASSASALRSLRQDGDVPTSVTVEDEQFLFDRLVPLNPDDLEQVAEQDGLTLFARSGSAPFDAVYGSLGDGGDGLARYLPTNTSDPETPCAAEAVNVGPLNAGETTYAFANVETDIPTDALEQVADAGGQPVYADPGQEQPSPELFVSANEGLLRFLIVGGDGRPNALGDDLPFAGQTYAFGADVTDQTDPGALTKVGCVGPFPAFAPAEQAEAPFAELLVLAGGRYLSFTASGEAPDDGAEDEDAPAPSESTPDEADAGAEEATPGEDEESQITQTDDGDEEGDDGEEAPADESTPPEEDEEPTEEATEEQGDDEGDDDAPGGLAVQAGDDLGSGGQPDGLPRELTVGEARYLYDRVVPIGTDDLNEVAQDGDLVVYARGEEEPFDAVYVPVPGGGEEDLARYLPEFAGTSDVQCPAEAQNFEPLDANGTLYAFAGIEGDLTVDQLQQVAESGGQPVYADAGAEQPFPELFVSDGDQLLRFVVLDGDGLPAVFAESLAFDGRQFDLVGEVTDQVDIGALTKVGCADAFPAYAAPEQADGEFTDLYVPVGGRVFQFGSGEAPQEASPPAGEPTEEPTQEASPPVEEPTEASPPVEEPTEAPTETPAPSETATEAPTETPEPTQTEEPTETPVPTETPAPTETTAPPTETPAPTETTAPTETAAPTETTAATTEPTVEATEEPAETPAPTEEPAVPATAAPLPVDVPQTAEEANLPQQVSVQNATYVFNQVVVDVDVTTLVEVDVITVQNVELTVYAEQEFQGVTQQLYCVGAEGQVVGQYVLLAATQPTPPPSLPPTIDVQNTTYVFNQVSVDIDITTLVEVEVVVVQNVELTVYSEQNVQGQPTRLFCVAPGGLVVGQYVETSLVVTIQQPQPTPQPRFQPPAVVPTLPPNAPPPAAATAIPTNQCPGDPGPINARGLPSRLPTRIQYGGIAYSFVRSEEPDEAGELTRLGCIGAFEVASTDQADRSEVLYLRYTGEGPASQRVYRFEAALTFTVEVEVSGRPRAVTAGDDQRYRLVDTLVPSVYSSLSVILFVEDPEEESPEFFYAVNVYNSVVGDVIGEYRLPGETDEPSDEIVAAAGLAGINPDLTINGQRYLLVAVHYPVGTTTNGFVTLFSADRDENAEFLLGRDKRRLELFIYQSSPAPTGG